MNRELRVRLAVVACILLVTPGAAASAQQGDAGLAKYVEKIPNTLITFEMLPVPRGVIRLASGAGPREVEVAPFWMARTETTWDLYDVYVYDLDRSARIDADAIARPSRPYVLPGDAFGHEGLPALGVTYIAATEFARWVSARTGHTYRIPTEAQWEHACRLGLARAEDAAAAMYWSRESAQDRTHPVASKTADGLGLHDMIGSVGEWVSTADGEPVIKGGSYRDLLTSIDCGTRLKQTPAWNERDPQLPKSRWWLSDGSFLGVRLIRVPDDSTRSRERLP